MRGTSIVAVAVAVVLMLAVSLSGGLTSVTLPSPVEKFVQFEWLGNATGKVYLALLWRCNDEVIDKKYCDTLLPPLRSIYQGSRFLGPLDIDRRLQSEMKNLSYRIRRSSIPKTELPTLHIQMTDGALASLQARREAFLAQKYPWKLPGKRLWVKAKVLSDDGNSQKKIEVKLRFKGTTWIHYQDRDKFSFHLRARKNQSIWGMKAVTVAPVATHSGHTAAMIHRMMKHVGVVSPQFFYVDVWLNNQRLGIMALEEHFVNNALETQKRREGPIIRINHDWALDQYSLYRNFGADSLNEKSERLSRLEDWKMLGEAHWRMIPLALRDYPIEVLTTREHRPGTAHGRHTMQAVSLFRGYLDGQIPGRTVFDYDVLSRWWIVTRIWGVDHGYDFGDRIYYFNVVTRQLEPVSWDNGLVNVLGSNWESSCKGYQQRVIATHDECLLQADLAVRTVWSDPEFQQVLLQNIEELKGVLYSREFRDRFVLEQEQDLQILSIADIQYKPISIDDLSRQLSLFSEQLVELFKWQDKTRYSRNRRPAYKRNSESLSYRQQQLLRITSSLLANHLRPFWFWSVDGANIELKNLTLFPVTIHAVYFSKQPESNLLKFQITVPTFQQNSTNHVFRATIAVAEPDLNDQIQVDYSYRGDQYTKPVILQFHDYETGYEGETATLAWLKQNGVRQDVETKSITFKQGHYVLETNLEIDKGWRLEFLPGAVLDFRRGARLKVNGPIHVLGRKDLPVHFRVTSDPTRDRIGSWGGLLIHKAGRPSILRHAHFTGSDTHGFSDRQDAFGLTGCITFFKSDVVIEHSRFSALQCEDGLNIISSEFTLDHVEFLDTSSDAFDSDFSAGIVSNSSFQNSGNDAIDVSNSQVNVSLSKFSSTQDKAISVGEESLLTGSTLIVDEASVGVVSKDKSIVNIHNSVFINVKNALMAYVKKGAWGSGELHCNNCLFEEVEFIAVEQHGSRITLDGKELSPVRFTRRQLQIVGAN
ncbi:right-handed parallel beta-helix repeat-containing protein [Gammaproteobacteria bacterium]|nr:right-handed parallel beta-helix repeat-containing protein [Gammaproteobacteria bacterium]